MEILKFAKTVNCMEFGQSGVVRNSFLIKSLTNNVETNLQNQVK